MQKLTDHVHFFRKSTLRSLHRLAEEGQDLPKPHMLFGAYIPENSLIHFPSPRGLGKTWLCLQVCLAISECWPSFLGEPITKHGHTLYINNELSETVMRRRAHQLYQQMPAPAQHPFKTMVYSTRRNLLEELPTILQIVEKLQPVLIVIDNLRMAFADVDTNSNREISRLMFTLLAICEGAKTTLLITDHFKKNTSSLLSDSDLQSGSGIKTDLVDGDFFLRKSAQDNSLRVLKRGKSRHFEDAAGAKLIRLNPCTLWFELVEENVNEADHVGIKSIRDKDEQKDIARALRAAGKSFDEIARVLGKGKGTIHRWLNGDQNASPNIPARG